MNQIGPACGANLSAQSARDYREKLLAALGHPLDDVCPRAILALRLAEFDPARAARLAAWRAAGGKGECNA
jgi:hypothetical protein